MNPEDVQATFVATLVDEWIRRGVRHAVVCPGSRSTPLALALADRDEIDVQVHHDERSGAFLALGMAAATGVPPVVVTTSGTAAVELHPAVVEAHEASVPLLVCTADRPPELRGVGAPQTIDQTNLYGSAARWFENPGVPDESAVGTWRTLALRALVAATGPRPGPAHLNLPFREPLLGFVGVLPVPAARDVAGRADSMAARAEPGRALVAELAGFLAARRGMILAGAGSTGTTSQLAELLGWPVVPDPRSGAWTAASSHVVHLDALLRSSAVLDELMPEVILRLGEPPASKLVTTWLAQCPAEIVVTSGRWSDPASSAARVLEADPEAVTRALVDHLGPGSAESAGRTSANGTNGDRPSGGPGEPGEPGGGGRPGAEPVDETERAGRADWVGRWKVAADAAAEALTQAFEAEPVVSEPGVARALAAALPPEARLVLSSSMPVRDVERYVPPRSDVRVLANRGANGIDGVISTAVGAALASGRPTGLLIGDVAFLHDSNGLLGAVQRGIDLVCVVVDNDGGGIFEFLPQAGKLAGERFEQLFGTPHGLDLAALARAYGATADRLADVSAIDLGDRVAEAFRQGGVHVLVVPTDRAANVAVHERLDEAAANAASQALLTTPSTT